MRRTIAALCAILILLGGIVMLFGCQKAGRYRVDYDGHKSAYTRAKDSYRAGETVRLYYEIYGTDTDYSFYLDDERLNYTFDDRHGFVLTFVMPDHDVRLRCEAHNSMIYQP